MMLTSIFIGGIATAAAPTPQGACSVEVVHQISHGECVYGKSYGCSSASTMWVQGCSAAFACGHDDVQQITCWSKNLANASCSCATPKPPGPFKPSNKTNMNGGYDLSETPKSDKSKYPTNYRDYPGGAGSFDVYSPLITQRYSQVWWAALPPVTLPQDIVDRFNGKTMAVVGFEVDQVVPNPNGDISVPINVVYNHHFESEMAGQGMVFKKIALKPGETPQMHGGHGAPNNKETWALRPQHASKPNTGRGGTGFGGANGGEYRKSFHGYPPGTAQLIDSPHSFVITPMQIDTWNRDKMDGPSKWNTNGSPFFSGPQPENSEAPQGPGALYSGMLECPLTTRVRKNIHANYAIKTTGTCADLSIDTAAECYAAVVKIMPAKTTVTTVEVTNTSMPAGCAVEHKPNQNNGGSVDTVAAIFNRIPSSSERSTADAAATAATATCGTAPVAVTGATASLVTVAVTLTEEARITISGPADVWFGVGFNAQQMSDQPWAVIVDGHGVVTERKLVDQKPGNLLKTTVNVVATTVVNGIRTVVLTRSLQGATADYYTFKVNSATSQLPFINAVGSGPDFSYHKSKMPSMLMMLPVSAPACVCQGSPMPFGDGSCKGSITYVPTNQTEDIGTGTVNFNNQCAKEPLSQLRSQHNPTCDLRTYVGGQLSCHHMWSLLDADQAIPWVDQPLEYHFKFRFWYQDYTEATNSVESESESESESATATATASESATASASDTATATATSTAASHRAIVGGWGANLGAGGGGLGAEFDVPKCAAGVAGCSKSPLDGSWVHTVVGVQPVPPNSPGVQLVSAHFHCHAPTCLSMSIAYNSTGEMICQSLPTYGGNNAKQPHSKDQDKFQEVGFIAVPPCMWSPTGEHGLELPPDIGGKTLRIVKTSNATWAHHGEMAHGQFYWA